MKAVRAVIDVLRDLIIGDDWRITGGIVVLLGATAIVHLTGFPVWWLPPLGAIALLAVGVLTG